MQDESRPAQRFQGVCALKQQRGSSVGSLGMLEPPMLLSAPQIRQGLNHEELELGSTWLRVTPSRLFQLRGATRYFWHTWAPLGAGGSAPSRSPAGTSQAVPGGGDASVLAVAAFPEQVLARRAAVLGVEGEVSPGIWGRLQPRCFSRGEKDESFSGRFVAAESLERGMSSTGGGPCFGMDIPGVLEGAGQREEASSQAGDAPG